MKGLRLGTVYLMALATYAVAQSGITLSKSRSEAQSPSELRTQAESFLARGDSSSAREICLHALGLPALPEPDRAQFLFLAASTHTAELDEVSATEKVRELMQSPAASPELKGRAHLLLGKMLATFGGSNFWTKAMEHCNHALALPDLPLGPKIQGHTLRSEVALQLRQFDVALTDFLFLAAHAPPNQCAARTLDAARTLWMSRRFTEASHLLDRTEKLLGGNASDKELLADLGLLRGLLLYDQNQPEKARDALLAVCALPGQNSATPQFREARLRLHLGKLVPDVAPCLKVLFVGSSHTQRGNVPLLVEQLSNSAPPEVPRIFAGEKTRMGTGMRAHWNEGDAPDTARGRMAAEPWDAVVVETFFRNPREDLALWTARYLELVERTGARLVVYESPAAKALPYPGGFQEFHANNLWLASQFAVTLAPCVDAWMRVLGPAPSEPDFRALYADWIHATPQGAYLSACCIFAALTGVSPEGLYHPQEIPALLAATYQREAWAAFQEALPRGK